MNLLWKSYIYEAFTARMKKPRQQERVLSTCQQDSSGPKPGRREQWMYTSHLSFFFMQSRILAQGMVLPTVGRYSHLH
jgi:predicted nucleic acid-binding Zn ribbon protein